MSGTGSAIAPSGEDGIATRPSTVPIGTIPDNPSQIAQTTSSIGLEALLNADYIYHSTVTVSTQFEPGQIIYALANHPEQCNYATSHVSKLFNTWDGNYDARFRLIGTAWYGGAIGLAIVPPNFSRESISKMSLAALTAYPNWDFDPKNTTWTYVKSTDQREMAFHYSKPFDDKDRTSFGGWLVWFIRAKLVTQSPDFTSIQMVIETKGNYTFDQPRPLPDNLTTDHPLTNTCSIGLFNQPMSGCGLAGGLALQVHAATTLQMGLGCEYHNPVGTSDPKGVPGINAQDNAPWLLNSVRTQKIQTPFSNTKGPIPENGLVTSTDMNINTEPDGNSPMNFYYSTALEQTPNLVNMSYESTTKNYKFNVAMLEAVGSPFIQDGTTWFAPPSGNDTVPISYLASITGILSVSSLASNESLVGFVNLKFRQHASQTMTMAEDLENFATKAGTDESWLYELVSPSGTPLLLLRLQPNGVFSTYAAAASTIYPILKGTKLRYLQDLPLNSPLPPQSTTMRSVRSELMMAQRHATSQEQYKKEVQSIYLAY